MSPAWFAAFVLANFLHVPEPVKVEMRNLWPSDRCAQMVMHGEVGRPTGWTVEIDPTCWRKQTLEGKKRLVVHELCHGVYDWEHEGWDQLAPEEKEARHQRVERCVAGVMRRYHVE